METELITEAFRTVYPYSLWWMAAPAILGIILFFWGSGRDIARSADNTMTAGAVLFIVGTALTGLFTLIFQDTADEDLLKSDISNQLQIENVDVSSPHRYSAEHWYTGKGPEEKFVEFALLRYEDSDNNYVVVYK